MLETENTATDSLFRAPAEPQKPLCVDLDGTLVKTDTLAECAVQLVKRNLLYLLAIPFWLLRGRAYLKQQIVLRGSLDVSLLPYNSELKSFLITEHRAGRQIVLATAANETLAHRVAAHLQCFSEVLASDKTTNLARKRKMQALLKRFGSRGFDYAGNSNADLPVWQQAHRAIVVNASSWTVDRIRRDQQIEVHRVFPGRKAQLKALVKALRVHQWVKNVLVFAPVAAGHKLLAPIVVAQAFVAFVAFSLCAAGVYLLNDLLDLEADRQHSTKRYRPFAAGELSIWVGLFAMVFCFGVSGLIALFLPLHFLYILAIYVALTAAYSMVLKQIVLVDVMVLCVLYTIRIMAGGAATRIVISPWLLGFSVFLFLSLALVKRVSELRALRVQNQSRSKGRAYLEGDLEQLESFGSASGYTAALVLALYVNSPDVRALYSNPQWLWLLCLLVIYWTSRVWLLAHRGQIHEDPIVFALKDKVTYLLCGLAAVIMVVAS